MIFLLLALSYGTLLCALIPPLAGGNETYNFGRAVGIAYGKMMVGDVSVPGGFIQLIAGAETRFTESATLPLGVTAAYVRRLGAIPLMASEPAILQANPIAVLNPVAYLPQAAAIRLGCRLGLRPLQIFYFARWVGMVCAVLITGAAIRFIPSHRYLLAAIALLPPLAFSRSTLDADQLTVAISFLFIALVWRAMLRASAISAGEGLSLAALGLLVGLCKSAYFLVPCMALSIPSTRFRGRGQRIAWMAAIVLPGLIGDVGYMLALRFGYLAHAMYHTWAGDADPAAQLAKLLTAPGDYMIVLIRTLVATPLVPTAIMQMLATFGPPMTLPVPVTTAVAILIAAVALTDPTIRRGLYPMPARGLALLIVAAVICTALTLLYIQWNGYGAPVIQGFQGRYLYPIVLLLLMSLHATRAGLGGLRAPDLVAISGVFGLSACSLMSLWAYYA